MIQFVGLDEHYYSAMATLLAKRHQVERNHYPFLPKRYEQPKETERLLREIGEKPYVSGIVAIRDEQVIGYMLYEFKEDAKTGRHITIDYPCLAIAEDAHPRLIRLMYAEAGAEWIAGGYFQHIVYVPIGYDRLVYEWLEQGFRFEQKYAILDLQNYEPKAKLTEINSITIRRLAENDTEMLKSMSRWNSIHQAAAPSWNPITKESLQEVKSGYAALAKDEEAIVVIGEHEGTPVGFHVYYEADTSSNMYTPAQTVDLPAASTNPQYRGRGVGKALADTSHAQLKEMGYRYALADWHTPNHLASYFWPKLGYQPFMIRMVRTVDNRIAWAHGK
ncbi:GNAT family N-acetyltransferase [Paenisporosarcina sp. NPDC076898]|uniref:GNAT family N-acetyltransferase n=1 Tax=unclassified Paenisporosarcina TaxID=2642018 RepID=UPI003D0081E6